MKYIIITTLLSAAGLIALPEISTPQSGKINSQEEKVEYLNFEPMYIEVNQD